MDPLDIISNLHNVKPVYKPIVSAVWHTVTGYEVLGQCYNGQEWVSLKDFFHDPDVPEEFKVEVDQHLLHIAISDMLRENKNGYLFINRNARQLMVNDGEDLLQSLLMFEKQGFSMERIVIEVTEHDFDENFENLNHLLRYYKTYGIQIAIDHIGAKSSNIDRIRQLKPHILKIDTSIIRNYNADGFQDILHSMAMLASRIGAALLFENIEDNSHLYFAWKHGARFYQGPYLARRGFEFMEENVPKENVSKRIAEYISREKSLVEKRLNHVSTWESKVRELLPRWEGIKKADEFLEELSGQFDKESFRMFICDGDGQQVSSNFRKRESGWEGELDKKGSNWAFRPYFLESTMQMKAWKRGMLSEIYSDIETRERIRTFSFPLSVNYFLFIDITYEFLFENESLLI